VFISGTNDKELFLWRSEEVMRHVPSRCFPSNTSESRDTTFREEFYS
jgi:hypothetical protein